MNNKIPVLIIIIILAVVAVSGCIGDTDISNITSLDNDSWISNLTDGKINLDNGFHLLSNNSTKISDGKSEIEIGLKNTSGNFYDGKNIMDQGDLDVTGYNYKYVVYNDSDSPNMVFVNVNFESAGSNYFILAKVPANDYNKEYLNTLNSQFKTIIGVANS
ncbi:hypothetical protein [Methanobrevibacter filiformis]|uniref:Uncharacterized protein n=1 Tax=Methanobrevibacter filiformis TaxID=55758 RepID=A0A166E2B6_9EURY|nr:hypothetical protein [Methanobrevibacter filiformis]KZX16202.1 hypothetical protein MBFIL_05320 [Methanobrevibacter filiformis]